MKILLINHYAGSIYHGMEFRPYYLSKEWVKMGHEVVIVAASFSHLRQKNIEMTAEIKEENIDGIRYIWLKTPEYNGNGFGRIRNMLTFIRKLYSYLPKITADFIPTPLSPRRHIRLIHTPQDGSPKNTEQNLSLNSMISGPCHRRYLEKCPNGTPSSC